MSFKSYLLLFCAAVFILAVAGLLIMYTGEKVLSFWSILVYIVVLPCVYAFLVQPLLVGERRLSRRRIVLLTFGVAMIGVVSAHSVWIIITPKWSFSVTTDKSIYSLGEDVRIMVSLENLGFISHSFKSRVSDPIVLGIDVDLRQVWFSVFHENTTEFLLASGQSIERAFVWNQTIKNPPDVGGIVDPGVYYIQAFIPNGDSGMPIGLDNLFSAWTTVNIVSTENND